MKSAAEKHTGIIGVLLLSDALDRAVECREHTTPDTEVSTQNRSSSLDRSDRTYPSFAIRAVSESLNTMPDGTSNSLKQDETCQRLLFGGEEV